MRDPILEAELLDLGCAQLVEGGAAFRHLVRHRLTLGDERYGDAYLTPKKDNLDEALEESADGAAWPMLELQRLRGLVDDNAWGELKMLTVGCIATAVQHDIAVRRFIATRRSFLGS